MSRGFAPIQHSNFRGGRTQIGFSRGNVRAFVGSGKGTRGAGQLAFSIQVLGDEELQKTLKLIPKAAQGKAVRPALRAGAKVIQRAARRLAPKATGALSRGITVRSMKRSRKRVGMRVVTPTRKKLGIHIPSVLFKRTPPPKGLTRAGRRAHRRKTRDQILVFRKGRGGVTNVSRDQWGFYYPAAVEFGTKHVAARPFMRTAYLTKRRSVIVVIRAELWKRLRKEVVKLGKKQVEKLLRAGQGSRAGAVADVVRGATNFVGAG